MRGGLSQLHTGDDWPGEPPSVDGVPRVFAGNRQGDAISLNTGDESDVLLGTFEQWDRAVAPDELARLASHSGFTLHGASSLDMSTGALWISYPDVEADEILPEPQPGWRRVAILTRGEPDDPDRVNAVRFISWRAEGQEPDWYFEPLERRSEQPELPTPLPTVELRKVAVASQMLILSRSPEPPPPSHMTAMLAYNADGLTGAGGPDNPFGAKMPCVIIVTHSKNPGLWIREATPGIPNDDNQADIAQRVLADDGKGPVYVMVAGGRGAEVIASIDTPEGSLLLTVRGIERTSAHVRPSKNERYDVEVAKWDGSPICEPVTNSEFARAIRRVYENTAALPNFGVNPANTSQARTLGNR